MAKLLLRISLLLVFALQLEVMAQNGFTQEVRRFNNRYFIKQLPHRKASQDQIMDLKSDIKNDTAIPLNTKDPWIISVLPSQNVIGTCFLECYDGGTLVSGWLGNYYYPASFLSKYNINGLLLWHKTLTIDGIAGFSVDAMAQTFDGSFYLCGGMDEDLALDAFIVKLNACGEPEWFKQFYTPPDYGWAWHVLAEKDGGCTVMILNDGDYQGITNRIQLVRFSSNGQIKWNQFLTNNDTLADGSTIESLRNIGDTAYMLCGMIYYPSVINPSYHYLHPYILNADSNGSLQWSKIFNKETHNGGLTWGQSPISNNNNQYFFGSKTHVINFPGGLINRPAIYKYFIDQDSISLLELFNDTLGFNRGAVLVDSTFFYITSELETGGQWPYQYLIKTDTLGNVIKIRQIIDDLYPAHIIVTYDNKLLCLVLTSPGTPPGDFNTYLYKYNQDLEFDTLNPYPFVYDSLCPQAITTDTLWLGQPEIVGVEELFPDPASALKVYPNPTTGQVTIALPDYTLTQQQIPGFNSTLVQYHTPVKEGILEIFDTWGRKRMEIPTASGQKEISTDAGVLGHGLYLLRYSSGGHYRGSGKMMVE